MPISEQQLQRTQGQYSETAPECLTPEEVSRSFDEATGEGWDFDGLSKAEFLTLSEAQQAGAIANYRLRMSEVGSAALQQVAKGPNEGYWFQPGME